MKRFLKIMALCALTLAAISCGRRDSKAMLPNVSGKAGEVIVVVNKGDWDGLIGTTIRENLACDCDFLPQKEPLYTLVNVVPSTFTNIFKVHRNLILVNIDPQVVTPGVVLKSDVWAKPQCVIQVNAIDSESANQLIIDNMAKILAFIEQAERDRVINNARLYQEYSLPPVVAEQFGGSPVFPSGYKLKKNAQDFIWIAYETTYVYQDIFIYKYPATQSPDEFSEENIIGYRNSILKANVPGMFDNTYMTTSTFATPKVTYMKYRGREFAETRGLWEVENDFMGGPFVSHSFYSKDGEDVIVLEAFVYAPRYDKRHYLRQVESLLYSFEWAEDSQKK